MIGHHKYIWTIIIVGCLVFFFIPKKIYGQYEGGDGLGFSYGANNGTCSTISIFKGTAQDGFDYYSIIWSCQYNLFSSGGDGDGYTSDSALAACTTQNIFTGDEADGYGYGLHGLCPIDSIVIETEVILHPSCSGPGLGSATVHIIDGFPFWQSQANYTFIWKNEDGDTLTGYPKTNASASDTISNLTSGEYTIVVYDANAKIDSLSVYINDCLYRGGEGSGHAYDSASHSCALTTTYTNSGHDGFDNKADTLLCDAFLFSKGGDGSGYFSDSSLKTCQEAQIFKGDEGDGYGVVNEELICESVLFTIGGNGNGFDLDTNLKNCPPVSIYQNSGSDGLAYDTLLGSCESDLFTSGGDGNGYAHDTNNQNCSQESIFTNSGNGGFGFDTSLYDCHSVLFTQGGDGNGFGYDSSLKTCGIPVVFTGDTADGNAHIYEIPCLEDSVVIEAKVLDQITCPISSDNGSACVKIIDGFPDWRSVPNFTFIWKNSAGDTLTGYPRTTTEFTDTLTNLGVDDYTIIVKDVNGNTDSAIIYINDCLYRGGSGLGFADDSSSTSCLKESIYENSGGDGMGYATNDPACGFGMYTSGGDGQGFTYDTSNQSCDLINIYTNSGGDGFDFDTSIIDRDILLHTVGGDGSGFNIDTVLKSCNVPVINKGDQADGADQEYIGCTPYIYDLPSTNNTCLETDTITSDGSDQWQLILLEGQVVAAIKDNGNNLGEVSAQFYVNDNPVRVDPYSILPSYYLDRNFKISAENLVFGASVRIRLYFLTNELQALINIDDNVTSIESIGITQYKGTNENCSLTDNIDNNDNLNYLYIDDFNWETYENGYFIEFNVNNFTEFFINNSTSLPEPYEVTADISVTSDYNGEDISCYGSSDGEATITPTYGIAPFTYQWDDPLSQTDSVATNLAVGLYRVSVVDNNGFTLVDSISVTQPDSIDHSYITANACEGEQNGTIDITALGGTDGYTYTWSTADGSGIVPGNEDQLTLATGTYEVTIEDGNSCAVTDQIFVGENVNSTSPTGINITNNGTCPGTVKTLSPVGGALGTNASWNWYADASCTALLHTGNTFDVDPATDTEYWLRAESNCDSSSAVSLVVNPLEESTAPTGISKSDDNIAPGTNVTLTVTGGTLGNGAAWKWYLDPSGSTSAGADGETLDVSPVVTTQYWVRAEGTCNMTTMSTTIVTVNPLPGKPATPVGSDTLCQDAVNTNYSTTGASGATTYIWSIDPPEAGSISGTGLIGTVDWSDSYYGDVTITVTGENVSGTGPVSDPKEVYIRKLPTTGDPHHIKTSW